MKKRIVKIIFGQENIFEALVETDKTEQELRTFFNDITSDSEGNPTDDWAYEDLIQEFIDKGYGEGLGFDEYTIYV